MQHDYTSDVRTVRRRSDGRLPAVLEGLVAGQRRAEESGEPITDLAFKTLSGGRALGGRHPTDNRAVVQETTAPTTA